VRSVLTQEVKAIAAARPRIDAACPKMTSGQPPFLGSAHGFGILNIRFKCQDIQRPKP